MVKLVVWVIIALLALSFFGISLRGLVDSPQTQDNFQFLLSLLQHGWDYFIAWFNHLSTSAQHWLRSLHFDFKD